MKVKIIDRHDSESGYSYVVPGRVQSNSNATVNCSATPNAANCSGASNTTATVTPSLIGSYSVRGATFSLLLNDGRIAVVNCASKTNLTQWTNASRRSCRMPIVDEIEVEFSGDNAKLIWPVSIDGKKTESETYKILGILKNP
jgi:hypothetical protein